VKTFLISLFYRFFYPHLLPMVLVMMAIWSVGFGLSTHIKGLDPIFMLWIGFLGVMTGRLFAQTTWPSWKGISLSAGIGAIYLLARMGGLFPRVWVVLWSISLPDLLDASMKDWSVAAWAVSDFFTGAAVVINRLISWIFSFSSGSAAYDPLATAWIWGTALWFISCWAGWGANRRWSGIRVLLPALVLLSAILGYVHGSILSLAILLALTMVASFVIGQTQREQRWILRDTDFSNEIRIDLAMFGIAVTLLLMTAALITPSISVRKILETVQNWMRPTVASTSPIGEPLGLIPQDQGLSPVAGLLYPGLPRNHLIGSGPELSERLVMNIRTNELPPMPAQALRETPRAYYWRGVTYDRYLGNGWATSPTYLTKVGTDVELASITDPSHYRRLDLDIQQLQRQDGLLYYTGQLEKVNQSIEVYERTQEDFFAAYISENYYQVETWVPTYLRNKASEAGRDYPDWIRSRYLALPEELPDRIRNLAVQISATGATPYDQVLAIESYLRTIPYNLDLPSPPGNRDIVDYFLFGLKQGYCDYYATAMVVLVRSIGIPARLVIGYANGDYDSLNAVYQVTEADAHSWPEVYFPGLGWVEFEPTASRPLISDTTAPPVTPPNNPDLSTRVTDGARYDPLAGNPLAWLAGAVVFVGLLWLVLPLVMDYRYLKTISPASTIQVLYQRLWKTAHQRRLPVNPGDTPFELAAKLADYLKPLDNGPQWIKRLADPQKLGILVRLTVRALYSDWTPGEQDATDAIHYWWSVRIAVILIPIFLRMMGKQMVSPEPKYA